MSYIYMNSSVKNKAKQLLDDLNEILRKHNVTIDFDNNNISLNGVGYIGKLQDNFDSLSLFDEAIDYSEETLCTSERIPND